MDGRRNGASRGRLDARAKALARKAASIALAALLAVWAVPATALAAPSEGEASTTARNYRGFADVAGGEWFVTGGWLDYVVDGGLMTGRADGTFDPLGDVSRGEVATVIWRMAGEPDAESPAFSDVDYGAFYGKAVAWARDVGVVSGVGDTNTFLPDNPIAREELALMMSRYAMVEGEDVSTDCVALDALKDAADVSTWARAGMGWAVDAGIVSGVGTADGPLLLSRNHATRAEFVKMATVLHRDVLGLGNVVDYADGALVVAPDDYAMTDAHKAVVRGDRTAAVEAGSVVVLEPSEANPGGGAIEVTSVSRNADGSVTLEGTAPEFSDVVDELSVTGTSVELVSFEPAPGVEVLDEPAARAVFGDEAELFSQTFSIGSFGTVGLDFVAEYTIGYRDGGFSEIDLAFETEADFVWECSADTSDAVKCGSATFVTNVPGLMIGADVYVTYTVEGGMRLEAVATAAAGAAYADDDPSDGVDGSWSTYCDSDFSCEAQLSARARGGIEPALVLEYLTIELVDASLGMGQEANAEVNVRSSGMVCTDMALWVYVDLSIGRFDSLASKLGLQQAWELLGRENNPTLIERHAEDGVTVKECTWEEAPDEPAPEPDPEPADPTGPVEPSAFFEALPDAFSISNGTPPEYDATLDIGSDGSVAGAYYSVDEESYPHEFEDTGQYYSSTRYVSSMTARFTNPTRVSEHVYQLSMVDLDAPTKVGDTWLEGDVRYFEDVFAGFVLVDEDPWYFVAPGATASELFELGITESHLDPATGEMAVWMLYNSDGRGTYLQGNAD